MNRPNLAKKLTEKLEKMTPGQLVLLAVGVSVLVAISIYSYLAGLENEAKQQKEQNTMMAVVATTDIAERSVIRSDMVKLVQLPKDYVQPDAALAEADVVGKVARFKILQGDVLSSKRIYNESSMAGFIGSIPADKRAVTIAISDITGISGFAKPGDRVDIMVVSPRAYKNAVSGELLLQNVLLLAVNKNNTTPAGEQKDEKPVTAATATLALSPEEAVRLVTAGEQGKIYLAMRPFKPAEGFVLVPDVLLAQAVNESGDNRPVTSPAASLPPVTYPSYQPQVANVVPVSGPGAMGYSIAVIRGTSVSAVNVK